MISGQSSVDAQYATRFFKRDENWIVPTGVNTIYLQWCWARGGRNLATDIYGDYGESTTSPIELSVTPGSNFVVQIGGGGYNGWDYIDDESDDKEEDASWGWWYGGWNGGTQWGPGWGWATCFGTYKWNGGDGAKTSRRGLPGKGGTVCGVNGTDGTSSNYSSNAISGKWGTKNAGGIGIYDVKERNWKGWGGAGGYGDEIGLSFNGTVGDDNYTVHTLMSNWIPNIRCTTTAKVKVTWVAQ